MTLDSTTAMPTGTPVTFTQTLVAMNQNFYGMTNVMVEYNSGYSNGNPPDTTFYDQNSAGDLYGKDFGIGTTISTIKTQLSKRGINLPLPTWMLAIKMGAAANTTWVPFSWDTTKSVTVSGFPFPVNVTIGIGDTAILLADTNMTIGGKSYVVKHSRHVITAAATAPLVPPLISWSQVLDAYVSADLATTVLVVVHPSELNVSSLASTALGIGSSKYNGSQTLLISHN
jgi:hypothetical protein